MKRSNAVKIGGFAIASVAFGCSLGLDESLIESPVDGGLSESGPTADGASSDSGSITDGNAVDAAEAGLPTKCAVDKDCTTTQPCLTGRCDVPRGECVFDVCPTASTTCSAAVCTNNVCGAPVTFKFASPKITVPAVISCGTPEHCLAVVHPWAFVGTTAGVYAVPVNPAADAITVDGGASSAVPLLVGNIAFVPSFVISSNDRVFVLGDLGATHIEVAYFDVPKSPLVTQITAQSTFVAVNDAPISYALPDGNGNTLIVSGIAGLPAGILGAPFPASITETATTIALTQVPTTNTGTRMFSFYLNGAASSSTLVNSPGTATPTVEPTIDMSSLGTVTQAAFTTGPDGSIRMNYATSAVVGPNTVVTVHVRQVIDTATSTILGGGVYSFDLAPTFTNPASPTLVGSIAWVNAAQVLDAWAVTAGASSQVQLLDNVKTAAKTLSFATTLVNNVGVATSAGKGWAVTQDSPTTQTASLYYIDPLCAQ